jgi:hypothetical protein
MKITKARSLFNTRIEIGQYFGEDKEKVWIELREPTEDEAFSFSQAKEDNMKVLKQLWRDCLTKHNFVNDDESEADKKDVIEVIKNKGWLLSYIIQKWYENLPLKKTKGGKSDK